MSHNVCQVYSDSEEGRKYSQFYNIEGWPYIAILDPRTGSLELLSVFITCYYCCFYATGVRDPIQRWV